MFNIIQNINIAFFDFYYYFKQLYPNITPKVVTSFHTITFITKKNVGVFDLQKKCTKKQKTKIK